MELISGACPYCGQMKMLDVPEGMTEQEQRDLIVSRCDCEQASRETALSDAEQRMEELFGETSVEKGFSGPIERPTRDRLNKLCRWVYDLDFGKTAMVLPGGDRATVERKGNRLAVTRERKVKREL